MKRTAHTQKWLDALRSGEYKQTRLTLRDKSGYCCLGVAASVLGMDRRTKEDGYDAAKKGMGMSADEFWDLMDLNDQKQLTFLQIADKIEEMLEPDECQ